MSSSGLTASPPRVAVPAARLRRARGVTTRRAAAARIRASVSAVTAVPTANPMAGVELFDVNGAPKQMPWWDDDKTVVVTFLRHFG
jgi:hypothetical protein|tara:strand:+ start:6031 stop:6288 length:258 start_codon:yes stop_codon:yes gene_type:complete